MLCALLHAMASRRASRVLGSLVESWVPSVARLPLGVAGELTRTFTAADVEA